MHTCREHDRPCLLYNRLVKIVGLRVHSTAYPRCPPLQVRSGNVIDMEGRLYEVLKLVHTQGHGRQLGNVQVCVRNCLQDAHTRYCMSLVYLQ